MLMRVGPLTITVQCDVKCIHVLYITVYLYIHKYLTTYVRSCLLISIGSQNFLDSRCSCSLCSASQKRAHGRNQYVDVTQLEHFLLRANFQNNNHERARLFTSYCTKIVTPYCVYTLHPPLPLSPKIASLKENQCDGNRIISIDRRERTPVLTHNGAQLRRNSSSSSKQTTDVLDSQNLAQATQISTQLLASCRCQRFKCALCSAALS